jgi:hypothetical protein
VNHSRKVALFPLTDSFSQKVRKVQVIGLILAFESAK